VELQIQEDFAAGADQFFDKPRAFSGEQLQAYFVGACSVTNTIHDLSGGIGMGDIEGYNQPLPRLQRAGWRHYRDFA
jgi:hypothetical protein